jgi:hypothetical protein
LAAMELLFFQILTLATRNILHNQISHISGQAGRVKTI